MNNLSDGEIKKFEIWFADAAGEYYRCRYMAGCLRRAGEPSAEALPLPLYAVIIAEDPATLQRLRMKGYCCIGFAPCVDAFFEGAEYVVTDLEGVSEDLAGRAYDHHFRRPHMIAETERLLIRESTEEDYPAIAAMMREAGDAAFHALSQGHFPGKEEYLSYIDTTYRFYGFGNWSVCVKDTGEIAGWCGLNPVRCPDEEVKACEDDETENSGDPRVTVLRYNAADSQEEEPHDESCRDEAYPGESSQDAAYLYETWRDEAYPGEDAELGYLLRRDMRGKGYALEACRAIMKYAQRELGITRFCVHIGAGNEKSFRLARKLGFRG